MQPRPAKPIPKPSAKRPVTTEPAIQKPPAPSLRKPVVVAQFSLERWEHETVGRVFNVTLERSVAEARGWEVVWLKVLSSELLVESPSRLLPPLSADVADRCLISRLEIDPESADPEILVVAANFPQEQTTFEYLISCWQRINSARIALHKRPAQNPKDASAVSKADAILDQLRDLVISYAGFVLQDPTMFPQPKTSKPLGIQELAIPLLAMSGAMPLGSSVSTSLQPHEVEPFIRDMAKRFEGDDLESTFGESLVNEIVAVIAKDTGGLASSSLGIQSWRAGVSALDALTAVKPLAAMVCFNARPSNPCAWNLIHLSDTSFIHMDGSPINGPNHRASYVDWSNSASRDLHSGMGEQSTLMTIIRPMLTNPPCYSPPYPRHISLTLSDALATRSTLLTPRFETHCIPCRYYIPRM